MTQRGVTGLHLAVSQEDEEMVKLLLKHGADVEIGNTDDEKALHWAVQSGNSEICRMLIDKGADIDAEDSLGGTPLLWAVEQESLEIVTLLLKLGADPFLTHAEHGSPCALAARLGLTSILSEILDFHPSCIEEIDQLTGNTLLHIAVLSQHKKACKLLVERGINPCFPNDEDEGALEIASTFSDRRLLQILVSSLRETS